MPISGPDTLSYTYCPGPLFSLPYSLSLTDRNTNPRHATLKRTHGAIATPARHTQERQVSTCKSGPKQHVHRKMQVSLLQRLQTTLSFVLCHETSTSEHVTAKYDSGHRRVPGQGSPFASSGKDRGNACTSERYAQYQVLQCQTMLDGSAWAKSRTSQTKRQERVIVNQKQMHVRDKKTPRAQIKNARRMQENNEYKIDVIKETNCHNSIHHPYCSPCC
jgi:hypothetical protein